jgi:hypothetical protein
MGLDPRIEHLDMDPISPFDVLTAVDEALAIGRLALANQLNVLTQDAKKTDAEAYLLEAISGLWGVREQLVASVEAS